MSDAPPATSRLHLAALALVVLAAAAVRARLLDVPLDRDEGGYAYVARLMLDGVRPYADAHVTKMPGVYAVYALALGALGDTEAAVHLVLLLANAATIVLVFLLGRRLLDATAGVAAAAAFAALSLSPAMLGTATYAEPLMLPAVVGGALLVLRGLESGAARPWLLAGAAAGLACLLKQTGAVFAVAAGLVLVAAEAARRPLDLPGTARRLAAFGAGVAAPLAGAAGALAALGVLEAFWFWTVRYPATYLPSMTLAEGVFNLERTLGAIVPSVALLLVAAALGVLALAREPGRRAGAVLLFAAVSLAAVAPGLYFRLHYFVLALPAVALLVGAAAAGAARLPGLPRAAAGALAALVVAAPVAHFAWGERTVLFQAGPGGVSRAIYGRNPFPEAVEIARYIRRHSAEDDTIAVLGSEPQIYFYAGRRAASRHVYVYPLMGAHPDCAAMQRAMIREIEAARPRFVVFANVSTSWLARPASDRTVFRWFEEYGRQFERVGVVDIVSPDTTRYAWDGDAPGYAPQSTLWLAVYRRRAEGGAT
jgi:hypothetical protein